MTASIDKAIATVRNQSAHGPRFRAGYCQRETREAFGIPSDGDATAAIDILSGKRQHRISGSAKNLEAIPRGAILDWLGGSSGAGHRAICDGHGYAWSVDIIRDGYWDRVPISYITKTWTNLDFWGWSEDICGVKIPGLAVVPEAVKPAHPLVHAVVHARPGPARYMAMEVLAAKGAAPYRAQAREWLTAHNAKVRIMADFAKVDQT